MSAHVGMIGVSADLCPGLVTEAVLFAKTVAFCWCAGMNKINWYYVDPASP